MNGPRSVAGAKEEAWKKLKGLTPVEREWLIDKIMDTYCLNCAAILDADGECPCADEDDEEDEDEDDEDGELDPEAEDDEEEEADEVSEGETT